ncbi:hypothetical protein TNCV_2554431 [Trichonephila clavipes]|nr:hypothetical protein TNCV_2554431 [Trichonephila clavipes]
MPVSINTRILSTFPGVLTVFGGPFLSLETFPIALKASIHIKNTFPMRSMTSWRKIELQRNQRPTVREIRLHGKSTLLPQPQHFETETGLNTNIPPPRPPNYSPRSSPSNEHHLNLFKIGSFRAPPCSSLNQITEFHKKFEFNSNMSFNFI